MTSVTTVTTITTPFLSFCIQYASIAIVYYDYILTFPMEVKYIWGSKFHLSTLMYILCRYSLVANVLYLLAISKKLGPSCDIWYKIIGVLSTMGRAAVIATFTARTYAIFSGSRAILIYLGFIGIICVALDISHVPGLRCVGSSSVPILDTLLSILMVVFEYSSAILMTYRCVRAFRISGWRSQGGFLYLVFNQGIIYFCVVSIFTTGAVILNFREKAGFLKRLLNALTLPLSCLLSARFLLQLRLWEDERRTLVSGKAAQSEDTTVLPPFQAAVRSRSSVAEEFGQDPVVAAQQLDVETCSPMRDSMDSEDCHRPDSLCSSQLDAVV